MRSRSMSELRPGAPDGLPIGPDTGPRLRLRPTMLSDLEFVISVETDAHNLPLQVCSEAADYLGGKAAEVCLTRSTTEGLALVYHGLPLKAGD